MTYKLTPLNFFAGLVLGVLIVNFIDPDPKWGNLVIMYLLPVIIISLVIDYIIQKISKRYLLIFLIELVMVIVFILLNVSF